MKLSDIRLPELGKEGKWFDYVDADSGAAISGVRVKLASTDQVEYLYALQRPVQEFAARQRASGRMHVTMPSLESQEENQIQALAKYILKDWEGLTDDAQAVLPCNLQNRLIWLRELPFRRSILALADKTAAFREQELGD